MKDFTALELTEIYTKIIDSSRFAMRETTIAAVLEELSNRGTTPEELSGLDRAIRARVPLDARA
jgi:anthranilate phosphoribosyltransferase